jgi:uncharacterized protein YjbI with pentapeptide repeats
MRWVVRHKTTIALVFVIIIALIIAGVWFWGVLVEYIGPKNITDRKDVVQVFALIVAGVVAAIGGIVGIVNVSVARRNLRQQIELERQRRETTLESEDQRSQDAALQAYFDQMGDLLTDHMLIGTDREDIRQLARAQTLTVLARLNGRRKGALVRFLYGAGLIKRVKKVVRLNDADLQFTHLRGANLSGANFTRADLSGAKLSGANLSGADFRLAKLIGADLRRADLRGANLGAADLRDADLRGATVTKQQLAACRTLKGAIWPGGQKYED